MAYARGWKWIVNSITYGRANIVLAWLCLFCAFPAWGAEITPFQTGNMSPLVQIFGLPAAGSARILQRGEGEGSFTFDLANNFAVDSKGTERLTLDGELYRLALGTRFGFGYGLEGGIEIPWVAQSGGILDGFIEGWHRFFGLPRGDREDYPRNRLLYSYQRDGQEKLRLDDSGSGIGDIRLLAGVRLYDDGKEAPRAVALRAGLKLPTGDSGQLRGSGSTDFSLWLSASDDYRVGSGHLTLFGAAGGVVMSKGDVLPDQQRNLAAFGILGMGWSPAEWIALKFQVNSNTPLYMGSELRELNMQTVQLIAGATFAFSEKTALDIGISEDVIVRTSPDVAFHLGLKRKF